MALNLSFLPPDLQKLVNEGLSKLATIRAQLPASVPTTTYPPSAAPTASQAWITTDGKSLPGSNVLPIGTAPAGAIIGPPGSNVNILMYGALAYLGYTLWKKRGR